MAKGYQRAGPGRAALHRDGHGMSKRLGHLVYRIACLIAAAALGLAVYVAIFDGPTNNSLPISLLAGGGVLIWIVGRAVRHAVGPSQGPARQPSQGHDG